MQKRIIPLPRPHHKLEIINNDNGLTKEQEILEFCKVSRTSREISALGVETLSRVIKDYLRPLIDADKLKMTISEFPTSTHKSMLMPKI